MACSSAVERLTVNQVVAGSIPAGPARSYNSVGRVPDLHSGCRRFKSVWEHNRLTVHPGRFPPLYFEHETRYA